MPARNRLQLTFMLAVGASICMGISCCRVEKTPVKAVVVNPAFLKLYSLRRTADAAHTVAVVLPDGSTWFREESPGLTLEHIQLEETVAYQVPGVGWEVGVIVGKAHVDKWVAWWQSRRGGVIGFEVNGRFVSSTTIKTDAPPGLCLTWLKSKEEAERMAETIRNGGWPEAASGRRGVSPAASGPDTRRSETQPASQPGR